MKTEIRKAIASLLVMTVTSSAVAPAWAETIGTESALVSDRERILVVLDRPDVQAALEARGVSADDARARIAALSDAEAADLAQQIDSAPAGAGGNPAAIVLIPIYLVVGVVYLVALVVGGVVSLAVNGSRSHNERLAARQEKRLARDAAAHEKRKARAAKKRSTQAVYPAVMKAESQ